MQKQVIKPKVKVKFYYDNKPSFGEKVSSKTKTVPDLSYSIQEIIDRFSRNNLVDMEYHEPVFSTDENDFDSDDLEKMRDMDLTDKFQKYSELDEMRKNLINKSRLDAIERNEQMLKQQLVEKEKQLEKPEKID